MNWSTALAELPLIAILRGLEPAEAVAMAEALCGAGFRVLEVPLNSPRPLESIRLMREALGDRALVGAGTVLNIQAVRDAAAAGGQIVISPNADTDVIAQTKALGLISLPAFFTPTEGFSALTAGADGLKLFPAEGASPAVLKAVRAVLPAQVPVFPVGGIEADGLSPWLAAGAAGFGIGSALFKPGRTPAEVGERAARFVAAWRETQAK